MRFVAWATLACCWNWPASAADQLRHHCAAVADDLGRLACYDAEYGRPEPESPAITEMNQPAPAAAVAAGAPAQAAMAAGSTGAVGGGVAAASAEADFGLSKWTKRSLDPDAAKALPQRITARIREVERQRDGRFLVTLENDQVWLQIETMSRARVAVADEVTIREASLGSFLLVTANEVATRVRRVR